MSDNLFHITTYFATMVLSSAMGFIAYFLLYPKFKNVIKAIDKFKPFKILRSIMLWLLLIASLSGFFSISFRGCDKRTYNEIIENRQTLVDKNRKQLKVSIDRITYLLIIYAAFVAVGIICITRKKSVN